MFTDVHANHLRDQLQAAEDVSKGWGLLLDYAVPRCPQAILDNLRGMLGEAEREAEGWRGLHNYADAHKTLSLTGQPGLGGYTTGARMDPPIRLDVIVRPCACGDPALEGEHHRDGRPCHLSQPESTVSLLVGGPQPAGGQPEISAPSQDPAATAVLAEGWTSGQEGAFLAFEGIHHGREQVAPEEYKADAPPPGRLASFLKPKGGDSR